MIKVPMYKYKIMWLYDITCKQSRQIDHEGNYNLDKYEIHDIMYKSWTYHTIQK